MLHQGRMLKRRYGQAKQRQTARQKEIERQVALETRSAYPEERAELLERYIAFCRSVLVDIEASASSNRFKTMSRWDQAAVAASREDYREKLATAEAQLAQVRS